MDVYPISKNIWDGKQNSVSGSLDVRSHTYFHFFILDLGTLAVEIQCHVLFFDSMHIPCSGSWQARQGDVIHYSLLYKCHKYVSQISQELGTLGLMKHFQSGYTKIPGLRTFQKK